MSENKPISVDSATLELYEKAKKDGCNTVFDRAADMKPCPIGAEGSCCKNCAMGPCRVPLPKKEGAEQKVGLCGASAATIAARNFARMIAAGCAAHSDHVRGPELGVLVEERRLDTPAARAAPGGLHPSRRAPRGRDDRLHAPRPRRLDDDRVLRLGGPDRELRPVECARVVVVVDGLSLEAPKTKEFVNVLGNLKIDRSCLVAINDFDQSVYKSARNIKKVDVIPVAQLNAGDICRHQKMLFTKEAFLSVLNKDQEAEE